MLNLSSRAAVVALDAGLYWYAVTMLPAYRGRCGFRDIAPGRAALPAGVVGAVTRQSKARRCIALPIITDQSMLVYGLQGWNARLERIRPVFRCLPKTGVHVRFNPRIFCFSGISRGGRQPLWPGGKIIRKINIMRHDVSIRVECNPNPVVPPPPAHDPGEPSTNTNRHRMRQIDSEIPSGDMVLHLAARMAAEWCAEWPAPGMSPQPVSKRGRIGKMDQSRFDSVAFLCEKGRRGYFAVGGNFTDTGWCGAPAILFP